MSIKLRIYYNAVFGAIGGLISWYVLGQIPFLGSYHIVLRDLISGALLGVCIGGLIGSISGVLNRAALQAVRETFYGGIYGIIGGVIGLYIGEVSSWAMGGGIWGRALGWMFFGLGVGISEGRANQSTLKTSYGAIGGTLGGFLGGAIFEQLRGSMGSYALSQALGLIVLGACIGSIIGVAERFLRVGWLRQVEGKGAGGELSITDRPTFLGKERRASIAFAKKEFVLKASDHGKVRVLINGVEMTAPSQPLKNGDHIQVGELSFVFQENRTMSNFLGRVVTSVIFCFALLGMASLGEAEGLNVALRQIEKSDFPQVTLYVTVTDKQGLPLPDLNSRQFEVKEDGQLVLLTHFGGVGISQPVSVTLTIDRSGSMESEGKIGQARQAAITFVELMREDDRTSVVAFDSAVEEIQNFTSDRDALKRQIRSLSPGGGTALYRAVQESLEKIEPIKGKKAVIALTDGIAEDNKKGKVIAFARKNGIPIFTIGLGSRHQIDEEPLKQMAEQTGGRYFYVPTADLLKDLYRIISAQLQNDYELRYMSPRPLKDGTERRVSVSVTPGSGPSLASYNTYYVAGVVVPTSDELIFFGLLIPLVFLLFVPTLFKRGKTT